MAIEIEVPQISVDVMQMDDQYVMMLTASSSGQQAKIYLCEASQNYQQIAKQLHDKIVEAGNAARRVKSGIIPVTELPAGLKNGRIK